MMLHSNVKTTQRYSHVVKDETTQASALLASNLPTYQKPVAGIKAFAATRSGA